jgi:macrolide transport system ATP-binding/permease protein
MGPALVASSRDLLTNRSARVFTVKGRLKPGVSPAAADAEAKAIARSLEQTNPSTNRAIGAAVRTELASRLDFSPGIRPVLGLFSFLVCMVLAVACANVANLMLARGRSRSREIAVRLAIGSSRARLVGQLMAESLLIALAGGALGLLMARSFAAFASTSIQMPGDIPFRLDFQPDYRLLAFTILVSIASAVFFGLVPALQSTRTDLAPALKSGEADQARRRLLGRSALVVVQIAGSMVLLVLATQLSRGFSEQLAQGPGFRLDHILTMSFDPSIIGYSPARTEQFYRTLMDRARAVPAVKSVALASTLPMSINNQRTEAVIPENYRFPRGEDHLSVGASTVDENYFATLGIRTVRGRGILRSDTANSSPIAVVNEAFARHYMNGEALGKRLRLGQDSAPVEIVGVTATGRYYSALESPTDYLYLPLSQHPASGMTLLAHTQGDPAALAGPLRETVRSVDPNVPVFSVRTMRDFYEQRSVKILDFISDTVEAMGLLGLALALVGLYALVAYQVAGRAREIGIRMAVGANRMRVVNLILRQSAVMSVTGVAIGTVLSIIAARTLRGGLLRMAFDPLVFALIAAGLLGTTFLAAAIPARRASKIDPMLALREE